MIAFKWLYEPWARAPRDPMTLGIIAAGGALLSAAGQISSSQAQAKAERSRAALLQQDAERRRQIAAQDAAAFRRDQSRLEARQRAGFAASGVKVFEGTPMGVQIDTAREGEFQAQRILVGGLTEATGLDTEAGFLRTQARNTQSTGFIRAGGTLLSGFARAGSFGQGGQTKVPPQDFMGSVFD